MESQETKFEYTYKAPTEEERREIESIRRQYGAKPIAVSKIDRLRELDARVKNAAIIWALVLGVVGLLIFGLGIAMVLEWSIYVWGIVVGAVGVVPMAFAYPVYKITFNKGKEKYGAEILSLSEELLKEE